MACGRGELVQLAVTALCALLVRSATAAAVRRQPYTLDEVTPSNPSSQSMNTAWASGPVLLHEYDGELVAVNVETKALDTLVPKEVFTKNGVVKAEISVDKEYVLLAYDAEKEFRHGARARYMAYRINDERDNKLKGGGGLTKGDSKAIQIGGGKRLQLAKWGTQGSQIAYVYENNIYYLPSPDAEPVKITSDGVPDIIFNGILHSYADALSSHPANTVGQDAALQFSPDGSKLVFARSDVSAVANATFVHYGRPGGMDSQYADLVTFRYPKAGTQMAGVSLRVAPLPSAPCPCVDIQQLLAPVDVVSEDHYLEAMAWVNDATVMAWWMNRAANLRQDVIYFLTSDLKEIPGEKGLKVEQKDGWVDVYPPVFQKGSQTTTYVTILWQPNESNVSFPHVVKVNVNSTKAITSGNFTVTKIYGWAANGTIYYEATEVDQPSTRQVYAVEEDGNPRCLSCDFTSPEDNPCKCASAYFNDDFRWCALTCKGPDPPFSTVLATADPEVKELTSTNNYLRKILKSKQRPQQVDDWVEVEGGVVAQVRLLLPPDLEPEGSEKRPAVVCVDGSPGSQVIEDTFGVDLFTYLATYRRYVVVFIDGRGSGAKGDRTLFSVYRRLGSVEVDDQITVTRWLTRKYPFIDASRVGITGRGYGGYAAAMALARDQDSVLRCAASVAPITSWIYADASLSERYMGLPTPDDNEEGYNASDLTRLAERFAGKRFLLMHGTADDAVLYQHSMALATALQDAGVLFEQQSYPDEEHWMRSLQLHAYHTIDDFFVRCFDRTSLLFDIIQELIS